jgi:hypothetical protein
VETDAPYLAPRNVQPYQHTNEPHLLPCVVDGIAHVLGLPAADIARASTDNTNQFFGLDAATAAAKAAAAAAAATPSLASRSHGEAAHHSQ